MENKGQASNRRQTVLVVDDDPDIRQVVSWALEDAGFVVHTASDGQVAVTSAVTHQPAVVILDIGLPNVDGTLVAANLRRICGEQLQILVITADGRAAEKARRAGAFAYLHKPFGDDALIEAVRRGIAQASP